jgi:hypothetical protein
MEAQEERRHALHCKTRSDTMIKYFAEKVSPGIYDDAARKEGFGVWKEEFMKFR